MERRQFLQSTAGAALLSALPAQLKASDAPGQQPNIVLIMADDLGWNELGCYGQKKIQTPHLDALARDGMAFTQAYAGAPVCAPSRCSLLTGKHGGHAYVRDNGELENPAPGVFGGQTPLPPEEPCIAKALKAQGYRTGCFGKWGLGTSGTVGDPLNHGFDRFFGYHCQRHAHNLYPRYLADDREHVLLEGNTRGLAGETYAPQRIADEMLAFATENRERPFFLYYPTVLPHLALQAPDEEVAAYRGQWVETPYEGPYYQPHPTPRACYAAMISFMDRQVGRLLSLLSSLGLDDNTVVLFTSDNGTTYLKDEVDYEFFESVGPLRGLKGSVYEGGIRVPLIARWPVRIEAGTRSDMLVANYDLGATVAEIAGTSFGNADGSSILPTLLGNEHNQRKHDHLIWDFAGYGGQLAIRRGPWKGVKRDMRKEPEAPLELYNLAEDIGEQENIAEEHPDVVAALEAALLQERTTPGVEAFRFGAYSDSNSH